MLHKRHADLAQRWSPAGHAGKRVAGFIDSPTSRYTNGNLTHIKRHQDGH
jgi:hypothetical protein